MRKILFFPLLLLIFLLTENVYALDCTNGNICYYQSGDSVKDLFYTYNNKKIGSDYYYQFSPNTWFDTKFTGSFELGTDLPVTTSGSYLYVNFALDYCVNGGTPDFTIKDSYYNYVDYTYKTNTKLYLSNGEWARASCYRSFIRLRLKYFRSNSASPTTSFGTTQDMNIVFSLKGNDSFDKLLRYNDLVYLSEKDYTTMLNDLKSMNKQDEINNNITNSDTTQANSSGSSFFSNFHVDSTRGFSSIITAPIRLIQGILDGSSSCSNLNFDIGLKHNSETVSNEVSLPCGSILWNNVPNAAVLLYWTSVYGLFAWWVLRDMYKFVDSIRDPDNKTEFLMNL